jgi:hypothetical protein
MLSAFSRMREMMSSRRCRFMNSELVVAVEMNFDKMSVKQVFQPLLLLIRVGHLTGWSELHALADRAIPPQRKFG